MMTLSGTSRSFLFVACALVGGVLTLMTHSSVHAQQGSGFKVIVNASNPVDQMPRKQVERIFYKKTEKWANGFAITVVDQTVSGAARQAFSKSVLQKDPSAVESYWNKLIFSGMGNPPLKLGSDAEVMSFVATNVGSIGYVSDRTALESSVKVLEVTP